MHLLPIITRLKVSVGDRLTSMRCRPKIDDFDAEWLIGWVDKHDIFYKKRINLMNINWIGANLNSYSKKCSWLLLFGSFIFNSPLNHVFPKL
jgi:hypothetical protein